MNWHAKFIVLSIMLSFSAANAARATVKSCDEVLLILQKLSPLPKGFSTPHLQGRFGAIRRFDVHTGIDLYCNPGDPVAAIEDGVVVKIEWFTGPEAGSSWWNPTKAVLIEGASGVITYGEIMERPGLSVGEHVKAGDEIGHVVTVLRTDKGRPTTMLHLELYRPGSRETVVWALDATTKQPSAKPHTLLDPTPLVAHLMNDIPQTIESAVAVITDDRGRTLALKRSKNDESYPATWSLPGGQVDAAEIPEQAVIREVLEETGLVVEIVHKIKTDQSLLESRNRKYIIHSFEVRVIGEAHVKLSAEHRKYRWLTKKEAKRFRLAGPVTKSLLR